MHQPKSRPPIIRSRLGPKGQLLCMTSRQTKLIKESF